MAERTYNQKVYDLKRMLKKDPNVGVCLFMRRLKLTHAEASALKAKLLEEIRKEG